ncbi:MAG: hypothetical protein PVI83_08175 [Lysobacterales bacterium]|jgi:hypothetical protein
MKTFKIMAVLMAFLIPLGASAEQLLREFSGSRTMQTPEFEVEGPWLIDWRVNSEFRDSMGLTIVLLNEPARTHAGTVMKTKYVGTGLKLFEEGGRYSLKVDSVLSNWTIKIIQLTPEEAEQYTPKEKGLL